MAVSLRFQRIGKPKKAAFRLVAIDARSSRDGKPIEVLGHYDPFKDENKLTVNAEKLKYWISQGALVSVTLKNLLRIQKTLQK